MRKILLTLFALIMVTALISCSPDANVKNNTKSTTEESSKTDSSSTSSQEETDKRKAELWEKYSAYESILKSWGITKENAVYNSELNCLGYLNEIKKDVWLISDVDTFLSVYKSCKSNYTYYSLLGAVDIPYQEDFEYFYLYGEVYLNDHNITFRNALFFSNNKTLVFRQTDESVEKRTAQQKNAKHEWNVVRFKDLDYLKEKEHPTNIDLAFPMIAKDYCGGYQDNNGEIYSNTRIYCLGDNVILDSDYGILNEQYNFLVNETGTYTIYDKRDQYWAFRGVKGAYVTFDSFDSFKMHDSYEEGIDYGIWKMYCIKPGDNFGKDIRTIQG